MYEKVLKDIRGKIKSGNKAKSKEALEKATNKLYGSKNK